MYNGNASGVDINGISASATVMAANFGAAAPPPASPGTPNVATVLIQTKCRSLGMPLPVPIVRGLPLYRQFHRQLRQQNRVTRKHQLQTMAELHRAQPIITG
ncbi:MAG: hypothetical protein R3F37_10685 [Candidatus Competibacteraceae bacterium]